jgi:hypothetical protein
MRVLSGTRGEMSTEKGSYLVRVKDLGLSQDAAFVTIVGATGRDDLS